MVFLLYLKEDEGATEDELVDGIIDWMGMSLSKLWEMVKDREAWCAAVQGLQRVRHDWATEQQKDCAKKKKKKERNGKKNVMTK